MYVQREREREREWVIFLDITIYNTFVLLGCECVSECVVAWPVS